MTGANLVRPSRDGDQFHYHWAARRCLELLPGSGDLKAVVIEGPSVEEDKGDPIEAGEELIDVGLYFGAEGRDEARLIRYVQLKHSTRRAQAPWTASGLENTIKGFAKRYSELLQRFAAEEVARRFRFEFTGNRPIEPKLKEALEDLASGTGARHPKLNQTLLDFTGLDNANAAHFFALFTADGDEDNLWAQRNLLTSEIGTYLPEADYDAPIQLKELVTRKATTEFARDPSIRMHDVLRVLNVSEDALQPAPRLIPDPIGTLPREQEATVLRTLLTAEKPLVIHADGGVGKSVLVARLSASMPRGSVAILYDCFGDGLYRNSLHFRHRHRDALVQIANELAARGLCHPLIPSSRADVKLYMKAFVGRLAQAIGLLRASNFEANLCVIIDAADNAEIAAEEQREPASFVRDLIRTPLPDGVRIAFTCRTHRRDRLGSLVDSQQIELLPFSEAESAGHLRSAYPSASDKEVSEFAFLSSSNPRVQALALSRKLALTEMLKRLGPQPTTVERAIGDLLQDAVRRLRDQAGNIDAAQIDLICQGLAVLRPLVPIAVLSQMSQTSESAIRSFALDLGRPLLLKGDSLHFMDEPAETWFRERFKPNADGLVRFLDRLKPLTKHSSYAAAALPQLLLNAGKLDEVVDLALSGKDLPDNPIARRDVELQRLTFALKASLQQRRYTAAAKLALKAGGECAGDKRQSTLIQSNTDLAGAIMSADRIEDVVSRRIFSSDWMGSHHAYEAGLLSGREEFAAEASSHLRMAMDWLRTWARLPDDQRHNEKVTNEDRAELAMSLLRLRGPDAAADFLRLWTSRSLALDGGADVTRRLIDIGRYAQVDELALAANNDVWMLLGISREVRAAGRVLAAKPLARLLRLLGDRRVKLPEDSAQWNAQWTVLSAVTSAIELGLRVLPEQRSAFGPLLRRYLPSTPPHSLGSRFGPDNVPLVRAYALEAALRGVTLCRIDVAPPSIRKELKSATKSGHKSQATEEFIQEIDGLLPWASLSARISCGRKPERLHDAIEAAVKEAAAAENYRYREDNRMRQTTALEWLRILRDAGAASEVDSLKAWLAVQEKPLWPSTLTALCRTAANAPGFESLAVDFAASAYELLQASREEAESRTDSYITLARAIFAVSPREAGVHFDRAVEIAGRIGDENLSRWTALLHLAKAAGPSANPRPRTAHRLSRIAELTYEYVARDKHFDWENTVEALVDLCPCSGLSILSRWRDRSFSHPSRVLPIAIYRLIEQGRLPAFVTTAFAGFDAEWTRVSDLARTLAQEPAATRRAVIAQIAYRYLRVETRNEDDWLKVRELRDTYGLDFPDIHRRIAFARGQHTEEAAPAVPLKVAEHSADRESRKPDWDAILGPLDLTDGDALHAAYSTLRSYDPPFEFEAFFREVFARIKVGREPELMQAFAGWTDLSIFQVRYLWDAIPQHALKQVAFRHALRDIVLAACRREPARIRRRGWDMFVPFDKFDSEGLVTDGDVIKATLEGFTAKAETLSAEHLFQLIDPLAASLSSSEADDALNFGIDLLEDTLTPQDSDGAWRSALEPPRSLVQALAGYVWAGLGSPSAAERWESAHVVRCVVELGWSEFVDALTTWALSGTAGPFVDQGLQFYVWHARQWLLIGMARGGIENAAALGPAIPLLELWKDEEHVLIREFAASALKLARVARGISVDAMTDLHFINKPRLPEEVYTGWLEPAEDPATSDESLEAEQKYYFGIDIGPYWFAPLGHAFGISEQAVEQRARAILRRRMGWAGGGWQADARHQRRIFRDRETWHSHGSLPKTEDLLAYHGYHAMMLVAAQLLKERPVRRNKDESVDQFQDWLSSYRLTRPDDQWIADRRDPRLVADPPDQELHGDKSWRWNITAPYIDERLVTDDQLTVLWGQWTGGDHSGHEDVSVRSALASRAGAVALLTMLQTADELGRFVLPSAASTDQHEIGVMRLIGWVMNEHLSARLDEYDPWGEKLHVPGPAPSDETIALMRLVASADNRTWVTESGASLRSETWTHVQGYGREAETVPGYRLSGNRLFIERLLESNPDLALVLSVEVRRSPAQRARGDDDFDSYPPPYVRYYLVEADGVPQPI